MSIGLLAVLLALLVLAQGSLFRRCALKRLTYQRDFSARAVFAGDTVELVEVIRNRKPLPLPWLRVESWMSNALVFGGTPDRCRRGEHRQRQPRLCLSSKRVHHGRLYPGDAAAQGNSGEAGVPPARCR